MAGNEDGRFFMFGDSQGVSSHFGRFSLGQCYDLVITEMCGISVSFYSHFAQEFGRVRPVRSGLEYLYVVSLRSGIRMIDFRGHFRTTACNEQGHDPCKPFAYCVATILFFIFCSLCHTLVYIIRWDSFSLAILLSMELIRIRSMISSRWSIS